MILISFVQLGIAPSGSGSAGKKRTQVIAARVCFRGNDLYRRCCMFLWRQTFFVAAFFKYPVSFPIQSVFQKVPMGMTWCPSSPWNTGCRVRHFEGTVKAWELVASPVTVYPQTLPFLHTTNKCISTKDSLSVLPTCQLESSLSELGLAIILQKHRWRQKHASHVLPLFSG